MFLLKNLRRTCAVWILAVFSASSSAIAADESYKLDEPAADARIYRIDQSLKVTGTLTAPQPGGKSVVLKIVAAGALKFRERRLAGAGRNAKAFRALRFYDSAAMRANVNGNLSTEKLRDERRLIVAEGEPGGPLFYSPSGSMTYEELELLEMPGDVLSLIALLPGKKVSVGEKWTAPSWAAQMLTGTEAADKAEITCSLESVVAGTAQIRIKGEVAGANDGAATTVKVSGRILYDLKRGYIRRLELKQLENSQPGPLSPAMDIAADVVLIRSLTEDAGPLSTREVSKIPLEPTDDSVRIRFDASRDLRFHHSRFWHVHHQSKTTSTLRMLERGNVIAQVVLLPLPPAPPGNHIPEEKFQADIRAALAGQLTKITTAEILTTKDKRFIYRVIAEGKVEKTDMQWIYYLCADPTGRQVSLVYTVEKAYLKTLGNKHEAFTTSLEFLKR